MSEQETQALSDLVNALQVIAGETAALRRLSGESTLHATQLEQAVTRAVEAVHRLRPTRGEKGGA